MLIGIDLGTTNSAVAVWREEQSQLVPNALGDLLTPSAVLVFCVSSRVCRICPSVFEIPFKNAPGPMTACRP